MMGRIAVPRAAGAAALALGVLALVLGTPVRGPEASLLMVAVIVAVPYFLAGFAMGALWPGPSWAWGLWVALPLVLLLLASVAFAGQLGAFLRHDLVPLAAAVAAGVAGGLAGAVTRERLSRPPHVDGA